MRGWAIACGLAVCSACGGSPVDINLDGGGPEAAPQPDATSDVATIPDGGANDAPVEAGPYGQPSSTYPAFTPWMAQLSNNGGPILTSPAVVTVTWDGDTGRSTFEGFGAGLGASSYWAAAVGEYGVGPTTNTNVHLSTTPPTTWSDDDVQAFIKSNVGGVLGTPTSQTIYVFYIAPGTTFMWGNANACNSIGGYHDAVVVNGSPVSYAVLPNCNTDQKTTQYASHEIGEASTDPEPGIQPAYDGFDDPYVAFHEWQRNNEENGDACEFFKDSDYIESQPFPYMVQRLWSNKQGPLGHSPCQPYTGAYFNVAPLGITDITVDLSVEGGPANFTTKGYVCALNATCQIPVGIYTDAATGPITVTVAESNPLYNPVTGRLALSIDPQKPSGVNGEITYVNVTVNQKGPLNAEMLTVITTLGSVSHYLPLLVQN